MRGAHLRDGDLRYPLDYLLAVEHDLTRCWPASTVASFILEPVTLNAKDVEAKDCLTQDGQQSTRLRMALGCSCQPDRLTLLTPLKISRQADDHIRPDDDDDGMDHLLPRLRTGRE